MVTGAFDPTDAITYWSNFGQCVDVFSPGLDIVSSCAAVLCPSGGDSAYTKMSGTSMACPHTTGVLAQLLQKQPKATPADLSRALTCEAARELLAFDRLDTISRNMLLQVPKVSDVFEACGLGLGCADSCSSAGVCLPLWAGNASLGTACHCDKGRTGDSCAAYASSSCLAGKPVTLQMADDGEGGGWSYAKYAILQDGLVVADALDSMPSDESGVDSRKYCLTPGSYSLQVTKGLRPEDVLWSLCGYIGGAPFSGSFAVDAAGKCKFTCSGVNIKISMNSASSAGWHGAYFALYSEASGSQLIGGSLPVSPSSLCVVSR